MYPVRRRYPPIIDFPLFGMQRTGEYVKATLQAAETSAVTDLGADYLYAGATLIPKKCT